MADTDFDYGGDVAETSGSFKNPEKGTRNSRLFGLIRLGTYHEIYHNGGVDEVKPPAPQAVAIFHLLGKEDKMDDGEPMFFNKTFPLKKGDKSFLHSKFIPAFGGMSKHNGFGSMVNCLHSLNLKGGKQLNEDGSPKFINFGSMSEIGADTLGDIQDLPKYAALDNPIGFLREDELTKEALEMLHPVREFSDILMQTEEFLAGIHPCQELIQSMYDANPERFTRKEKDEEQKEGEQQTGSGNAAKEMPKEVEQLDTTQEF